MIELQILHVTLKCLIRTLKINPSSSNSTLERTMATNPQELIHIRPTEIPGPLNSKCQSEPN